MRHPLFAIRQTDVAWQGMAGELTIQPSMLAWSTVNIRARCPSIPPHSAIADRERIPAMDLRVVGFDPVPMAANQWEPDFPAWIVTELFASFPSNCASAPSTTMR